LANALYANNNRISELAGMRRYYVADRDRNKLRTLVGWQATDPLSFEAGLDLTNGDYPASTYGLQDSKGWNLSLDATYLVSANWSATANSNTAAITDANLARWGCPATAAMPTAPCSSATTVTSWIRA
jgi:hypothetical protein